jgi:putative transposase
MAKGKRHTAQQAIRKLRDIEVMLAQGRELELVLREMEISEQTYKRWQDKYGLMSSNEAKRLRELEAENADLKSIVADLALQNKVLKDVNS